MNLSTQRDEKTGKYILYFDASLYKSSSCLRKVYYTLIRGLRREGKYHKMEYGTAFHKYLQAFYEGQSLEAAMKLATDHYASIVVPDSDWRHIGHLVNTIMQYDKEYRGGDMLRAVDSTRTLEAKFAYPFYQTSKVEVLLCGTIDMIGLLGNRKVIVDHKTTSIMGADSYLNSYQLSPQLMVYRLIYDRLFPNDDVGCLINGIFLSKTGKTKFQRSMIFEYTKQQIKNLELHLLSTVKHIVNEFEIMLNQQQLKPENFMCSYISCDEKFGQCQFSSVCLVDNDEDKESVIANEFVIKQYNPLKFSDA